MFRRAWALPAMLLLLPVAGCADESPEESQASLDDQQSLVVDRMEEALAAVDDAGLVVEAAGGAAEYCNMPPDDGATYRTGARLEEGDDPAAEVGAVRDALTDVGWEVETEEGGSDPYVNLTRDDLRAGISLSRRQDQPGVTFGITAPCLSVNDDFRLPADDLEVDLLD